MIPIHMPGLPTRKQEFGSRHRDSRRCCQTHVFLPTRTSLAKQLVRAQRQQHEIYTHVTTIYFDQIKSPLDTLDL